MLDNDALERLRRIRGVSVARLVESEVEGRIGDWQ